jgi:glutamyl-tRNA synthetase
VIRYHWIQRALGVRHVEMHEYSRLNFVNAVLSKRKLQWFVDQGIVEGWDDPRFPTVRGIMRRGLTITALRDFVHRQGFSQGSNLMEWDKIWAINVQVIDPIAPRYWCIATQPQPWHVALSGDGVPAQDEFRSVVLHKKNESCGTKAVSFSQTLLLEDVDAASLAAGEEITLMNWGNAFVVSAAAGRVELKLHLEGDFKKTKKKVCVLLTSRFIWADTWFFSLRCAFLTSSLVHFSPRLLRCAGALDVLCVTRRRRAARTH